MKNIMNKEIACGLKANFTGHIMLNIIIPILSDSQYKRIENISQYLWYYNIWY